MNQFPQILVDLAKAFEEGEDVRPALHDALIDEGYPNCAEWCFVVNNCNPGKGNCGTVMCILGQYEGRTLDYWESYCKEQVADRDYFLKK